MALRVTKLYMHRVVSIGHGGKEGHGMRSRVKTPSIKGLADAPFSESPVQQAFRLNGTVKPCPECGQHHPMV